MCVCVGGFVLYIPADIQGGLWPKHCAGSPRSAATGPRVRLIMGGLWFPLWRPCQQRGLWELPGMWKGGGGRFENAGRDIIDVRP